MQEQYAELYKNRQSGFTQFYKLKNRAGDNTPMALIRMVDIELLKQNEEKEVIDTSTTLKEVKKDIEQKTPRYRTKNTEYNFRTKRKNNRRKKIRRQSR